MLSGDVMFGRFSVSLIVRIAMAVLFTVSSLTWPNKAMAQACVPGTNQIALFVDANYRGQCRVLGNGSFVTPTQIGLPNDTVSSVRLGTNAIATLCQHDRFRGNCETLWESYPNLSTINLNDATSSLVGQNRSNPCVPGLYKVAVYIDAGFSGQCTILGVGKYLSASLMRIPNDSASSILIGKGYEPFGALLCQHNNWGGICEVFTHSDANLTDNPIGNDTVSSADVDYACERFFQC